MNITASVAMLLMPAVMYIESHGHAMQRKGEKGSGHLFSCEFVVVFVPRFL
jgi:hypothetical protein